MVDVWKVYCERLKGETASMIVAGAEFSLSQEAAMSRWIKGRRPSELALVRSAAREEMLSWVRLSNHRPPRPRPDPRGAAQALPSTRVSCLAAPPPRVDPDLPLALPRGAVFPRRPCLGRRRTASVSARHPHRALAPARVRGHLARFGPPAPPPERRGRLIFRGFCRALGLKNPCAASTPVTGRCG